MVDGQKAPLMIRKSDGGYGYGTTDMAALSQRIHVRAHLHLALRARHHDPSHSNLNIVFLTGGKTSLANQSSRSCDSTGPIRAVL